MTGADEIYAVTEIRGEALVRSTYSPSGKLDVTVSLTKPEVTSEWQTRLSEVAVSACFSAIHSLSKGVQPTDGKANYVVKSSTVAGDKEFARWNMAHETPEMEKVRLTLDEQAHLTYVVASSYLRAGDGARDRGDMETAGSAYKEGLSVLGDAYLDKTIIDDTGMKLIAAKESEKRAGLAEAAPLFRKLLAIRTSIYANREHLSGNFIR